MEQKTILSPESRLPAALLYLTGAQLLNANIDQLVTMIQAAESRCSLIKGLKFVPHGKGFASKIIVRAVEEMVRAKFVRWNPRRDILWINRSGPIRPIFLIEICKLKNFEACQSSISDAASFIGFILGPD